ncbi:MAG: Protein SphX [Fimbriimonadaceae bacterium]|nr:Protein SphX [Fimbriimonadaceae bacterium]
MASVNSGQLMRWRSERVIFLAILASAGVVLAGCGSNNGTSGGSSTGTTSGTSTTGTAAGSRADVIIDGSSTVEPLMSAISEEFTKTNSSISPSVGTSGTGGGFKKFVAGEIDISNASRPITPEEAEQAKAKGIEYIEIPIAFDGLTIVVNPKNTWAKDLTIAELKMMWEEGSKVSNWKEVRSGFPDKPLKLYGAGTDSGTFDYFTEAVNGKSKSSRADYQASEDDNTLVQGVSGDEGALGYFGFSYYEDNKEIVAAVAVDGGKGPVTPSFDTIQNGTYSPLSRPLFIYVNKKSLESKPGIEEMVKYIFAAGSDTILKEAGFVPLPQAAKDLVLKRLAERKTGTLFHGAEPGLKIEDILSREKG